jgi:hypothetical protein
MAVIDGLEGLQVSVIVQGQPTAEYEDVDATDYPSDSPAMKTCHKYVESKDDAEFAVRVELTPESGITEPNHGVAIAIDIDGQQVTTNWLATSTSPMFPATLTVGHVVVGSSDTGGYCKKNFVFSTVTTGMKGLLMPGNDPS